MEALVLNRALISIALTAIGIATPLAQEKTTSAYKEIYHHLVALKTVSRTPSPDGAVVTLTLQSGAFVKLRAIDIDYDRTAAYTDRVVVKPTAVRMLLTEKSMTLVFSRGWLAPVWEADVDAELVRANFPAYRARVAAEQAERYKSNSSDAVIRAKCERDWPDDYVMRNYCEERQREAKAKLNGR